MKSLSEIETLSKRATKAVGFSWGVSEEVGKSVRLLELFGLPGIKNLSEYFSKRRKENFENLSLIMSNNIPKKLNYCPISLGVSFIDQVRSLEEFKKCKFSRVAYPLLLLPFLSRSSEIIGKKIFFKFDRIDCLLNFNISISSNILEKNFPSTAECIEITFLENDDNFSESDWQTLYKLSEETFVEESESLKKDAAGAGLTDND